MSKTIATYMPSVGHLRHPGLLGRSVFDDMFNDVFNDAFPRLLKRSTSGYPVADIYRNDTGDTVMEFALAGFSKGELSIEIKPEKRSITIRAQSGTEQPEESGRRIAKRSFEKTYVNLDNNLDLSQSTAKFENGLLRVVVPTRPEAKPITVKIN